MRVRLVSEKAMVYAEPALNSSRLKELVFGDDFELENPNRNDFNTWGKVTLLDGRHGYVPAHTKFYELYRITLRQDSANLYQSPPPDSIIRSTLKKGDQFYLCADWHVSDQRARIIELSCNEGFMDVDTKVKGGHKEFNTTTNNSLRYFAQLESLGWGAITKARDDLLANVTPITLPVNKIIDGPICDVCGGKYNAGKIQQYLLVRAECGSNYPYSWTNYTIVTNGFVYVCDTCFQRLISSNTPNKEHGKQTGFWLKIIRWFQEMDQLTPEQITRQITLQIAANKLLSQYPFEVNNALNPPDVFFVTEPRYYIETIEDWERRKATIYSR